MLRRISVVTGLMAAVLWAGCAVAQSDPTLHEVYEAAQSGHVDRAQQMMQQVLRDHPRSGKAHYVAAEIDARAGDFAAARREFATAESLAPGLPFAKPESAAELRRELAVTAGRAPERAGPGIPWAMIALLAVAGVLVVAWLRRRPAPGVAAGPGSAPPLLAGPGGLAAPAAPAPSSGILGSVASGLAVGAGVVAGEELARHLFEPGRHADLRETAADLPGVDPNADLGGTDFGVSGADSWDDSGSSAGGDDWN
jgi:hypothetical protein